MNTPSQINGHKNEHTTPVEGLGLSLDHNLPNISSSAKSFRRDFTFLENGNTDLDEEEEDTKTTKLRPLSDLILLEADYGFLRVDHELVIYLEKRLSVLLPDVPNDEIPSIRVLSRTGEGINAFAHRDWSITITPELIGFIENVEELDYVLLHEVTHLVHEHHEQLKHERAARTLRGSLGIRRLQEYDADIVAFNKMAEPNRNSNPMGSIIFLERLRKIPAHEKGWDPSHGTLTDRILNLKSIAGALELDPSPNPFSHRLLDDLQKIPKNLRTVVSKFQEGGRIGKLLETPPSLAINWSKWANELGEIISNADVKLLSVVASDLIKKLEAAHKLFSDIDAKRISGLSIAEDQYESRSLVLGNVLKRLNLLVSKELSNLSSTPSDILFQKALNLSLLLETPLNLPDDHLLMKFEVVKENQKALQNRKGIDLDKIPLFIENLSLPVSKGKIFKLAVSIAESAIGSHLALFDTKDGIDTNKYLKWCNKLVIKSSETEERLCFEANGGEKFNATKAWTRMVLSGVINLADIDALDESYAKMVEKCQKTFGIDNIALDGETCDSVISELSDVYKSFSDEISNYVSKLLGVEKYVNIATELSDIRKKICVETQNSESEEKLTRSLEDPKFLSLMRRSVQLFRKLPKEVPLGLASTISPSAAEALNKTWDHSNATRTSIERDFVASYFGKEICFEKKEGTESSSKGENSPERNAEFYLKKRHEVFEGDLVAIRFMQGACLTDISYREKLISAEIETNLYSIGAPTLNDLNRLISAFDDFETAETLFGVKIDLSRDLPDVHGITIWQEFALGTLKNHLSEVSANNFFTTIREYLQEWHIPRLSVFLSSVIEIRRDIFRQGISYLGSSLDLKEPETVERLLDLSFFMNDVTRVSPVQSFLAKTFLNHVTFEKAVDVFFNRYRLQSFMGAPEALEVLDDKARTKEDLSLLREKIKALFEGDLSTYSASGKGVVADALAHYLLRRADPPKILDALLKCSENDYQLQSILHDGWWSTFRVTIATEVEKAVSGTKTLEELEVVFSKPPLLIDDMIPGHLLNFDGDFPIFTSLEGIRDGIYRIGGFERYALLRKLLSGKDGVLTSNRSRLLFSDAFLESSLKETGETKVLEILKNGIKGLFEIAPQDELTLVLSPLLRSRIANAPAVPNTWDSFLSEDAYYTFKEMEIPDWAMKEAEQKELNLESEKDDLRVQTANPYLQKAKDATKRIREIDEELAEIHEMDENDLLESYFGPTVEKRIHYYILGRDPDTSPQPSPESNLGEMAPSRFEDAIREPLNPLEFCFEIGKNLGAPGTRFLQLFGQSVDIPNEYAERFSEIYDSRKGQAKLSAWETIQKVTPEFAAQISEIGERLGGGSLYTVYDVLLKDGSREAVRVMNPNAWYHTRMFISVMRDTIESLKDTTNQYEKGHAVVDLVEEWIQKELQDETFEEDDKIFYNTWHGWKPNEEFKASVVIPRSKSTGTTKIRRDEYIDGNNFTELSLYDESKQKEFVSLGIQLYLAQIRGASLGKTLVHSDISVGNLRVTSDGNLAILDRGMYLALDISERIFLGALSKDPSPSNSSRLLIDYLSVLPQNQEVIGGVDRARLILDIEKTLRNGGGSIENHALKALVAARSYGLKVPLKFSLLFKNLNAWGQIARRVGFSGIREALEYKPGMAPQLASNVQ